MADTFPDLDAVAANGDGTLWQRGPVWSYRGAPNDTSGTNLKIPLASVADARVRAALEAGVWVAAWVDRTTSPVRAIAVVKAPIPPAIVRARDVTEFGSAA